MKELLNILDKVNCSSRDNGSEFIDDTRIQAIIGILDESNYQIVKNSGLSLIYIHKKYDEIKPAMLISCHIDSLYSNHFSKLFTEDEIVGSFDNSICNTVILYLMIYQKLPSNVIITFTGDEEDESRGAVETIEYLINKYGTIWDNLEMVITLDITSEGYDNLSFTIENYFNETCSDNDSHLKFSTKEDVRNYLMQKLKNNHTKFVSDDDADPDESWEYDEYDLNCFTFCLPARPHPDNNVMDISEWMHDDKGIIIKKSTLNQYSQALTFLINEIFHDFS